MGNADIARAFSGHRFEEAFEHLADDVVWVIVGGDNLEGRDVVVTACRETTAHLTDVDTTWDRVVCADGGDVVAVDVQATYAGPHGTSVVSSCDIYEFTAGALTRITSYTAEIEPPA